MYIHMFIYIYTYIHKHKHIKVVPYTFVRRGGGVPVRENTYLEPSACEVGRPVPFLAAFFSPVFPPDTHSLLGEQSASIQSRPRVELELYTFRRGSHAL